MRKTLYLAAALTGVSFLLRRTRRFGPFGAVIAATLLEEIVRALRHGQTPSPVSAPVSAPSSASGSPPQRPALWARLMGAKAAKGDGSHPG